MRANLLFLLLALPLVNCSKPRSPQPAVELKANGTKIAAPSAPAHKVVPCELLTSAEIEAVQGEPVVDTKPSVTDAGAFTISQCYFALKTSANSVVISVTQRGPGQGAREPREFWESTFGREESNEKEGEHEKDREPGGGKDRDREGEEKAPPQKIPGVGDEAFWTGNSIGGALYVLSGDLFLRIGIGGPLDQQEKIERSKKLAEIILRRL